MRDTLELRNRHLLRDVERLILETAAVKMPTELEPYANRIQAICKLIRERVRENLKHLSLGQDAILEDVLSNTQQATQLLRLVSSRMVAPILRCSTSDRLCLKLITWLHRQHTATDSLPAAFTDGDCAVWPLLDIAPIYFFPAVEQRVLLYLPLYFHEFGHLLYACHKQELDALVRDLQQEVNRVLRPTSLRNDKHAAWQSSQREAIVTTWYKWAQEFLCDSVGLTIGGPAFLWAFSAYLGTLDRGDYYRPPSELRESSHPVTWLRVRILVAQASLKMFEAIGKRILDEWQTLATTMGVVEDHHGFYDDALEGTILRMLNDALEEVAPRRFAQDELNVSSHEVSVGESPVSLVHKAWDVFFSTSEHEYAVWEQTAIENWLGH